MSDTRLTVDGVYKKFKKGEIHDSLRDLIPAFLKRRLRSRDELDGKEFWALRDLSFEVMRGEALGVIGPNGAGKSTLLKLLSGIMIPTKGSLSVKGRLSALIEVGAGFHPDLTGRENVFLNGVIMGMTRDEVKRKFDAIVAFSGLEEFIDTPVKRYSSGMYARLGFSVAAHVEPDILVVDEVLSVGDYAFQTKCAKRMGEIIGSGATVIFVSHNLRAVSELCSRSVLLDRGTAVEIGPTKHVIRSYLDRTAEKRQDLDHKEAYVSSAVIRDRDGPRVDLASRQTAWLDIEVKANAPCERLAVVLEFKDDNYYSVFHTSTERLGHGTFSLNASETFRCVFELDMNFAQGTYYLAVYVHRYDIQKQYDAWFPAGTIYVNGDEGVGGAVNLDPRICKHETVPAV